MFLGCTESLRSLRNPDFFVPWKNMIIVVIPAWTLHALRLSKLDANVYAHNKKAGSFILQNLEVQRGGTLFGWKMLHFGPSSLCFPRGFCAGARLFLLPELRYPRFYQRRLKNRRRGARFWSNVCVRSKARGLLLFLVSLGEKPSDLPGEKLPCTDLAFSSHYSPAMSVSGGRCWAGMMPVTSGGSVSLDITRKDHVRSAVCLQEVS